MIDLFGGPYSLSALLLCFGLCYLIGSIPFGVILTRFYGAGDLRSIGSGNIGATNVLRTGRKGLALATLLFDALKGGIPAWIAAQYAPELAVMAGLGAVVGHCFPVWLKFNGGKGVATAAGVVLALTPIVALVVLVLFALSIWGTRYVSLGSVLAAIIAVPTAYLLGHPHAVILYGLLAIIIVAKHQANIRRLLAGNESKVSLSKSPTAEKS